MLRRNTFGCLSSSLRRLKADLILVYKIIFGFVDLDAEKFFKLCLDNSTRGHEFKIIPEHSVISIRKHFIAQRISQVGLCNELLPQTVNFASLAYIMHSKLL